VPATVGLSNVGAGERGRVLAVNLERELADIVGDDHVLTDPSVTASYTTDWTGRFHADPGAVVRPGTTEQLAAVVRVCAAHGVAMVAQGGNTGLVGGSTPRVDEGLQVVLSTRRLTDLGEVDTVAREVTAGAGVPVSSVQRAAKAAGLRYGVDLASRDSATIGGTVATNAGGLRVVRHGTTRAQVRGLQYVLADGRVVDRLAAPPQDNAGFDLTGLLVGSEGTLAIVTAARLRLVPPETTAGEVTLIGCRDMTEALSLIPPRGVRAAEVMLASGLSLVRRVGGLAQPLEREHPVYLLLETDELPDLPDDIDAAVDPALWAYREQHTEAIATEAGARGTVVHKLDVSVPLERLGAFVDALAAATTPYDVFVFGHIAMGNLHVNVLGATDDEVDGRVLTLVAQHGGSIAAEHGIGIAKARWLPLTRSAAEIDLLRAVKAAFDPHGLLNPGVMLPG
jgi:FAD/FMN-containing dehydrogenase